MTECNTRSFIFLLLCLITMSCSCSVQRMTAKSLSCISEEIMQAYQRESDLTFARQSMAAGLKFIDGAIAMDPDNRELLITAARGYAGYAWACIESELEHLDISGQSTEKEILCNRAADFYNRAWQYGLTALNNIDKDFMNVQTLETERLKSLLMKVNQKDIASLYWTTFAWANLLKYQPVTSQTSMDLAKIRKMLDRVLKLDEQFHYGHPLILAGVVTAKLPPLLGGDPIQAEDYFKKAIDVSGGGYLPARLAYAKEYLLRFYNRDAYQEELQRIVTSELHYPVDACFDNAVARELASHYLHQLKSTSASVNPGTEN